MMMKAKPKLAIVANTAWNIRNFRLGLMRFLRDQGYEIVAIAPPDESVQIIENEGFRFVPLEKLSRDGTNPLADLALVREFFRIYRSEKIKVALQYTIKPNIYGSVAARLAGVRTICTVTGLGYTFLNTGPVNKIVKQLYRFAFGRADKIIFQNRDDLELFLSSGLAEASKCGIIPGSGIDTDYFSPQAHSVDKEGVTRFLFVGRLLNDKGIRELIEAIGIVTSKGAKAEFGILGALDKGNPAAISEAELQRLSGNPAVIYHGVTDDTRPFIAAADAIVLPSYREGLPRVNLEALSMAKPVVTTDVPGCRDTVEHGKNGFLVAPESGTALAEGLQKFMDLSPAERQAMGHFSRQKALRQFDLRIVQARYLEILEIMSLSKSPAIVEPEKAG